MCVNNMVVFATGIRVVGTFAIGPEVRCACRGGNPKFCSEMIRISTETFFLGVQFRPIGRLARE